jgi:hypothetical protein
VNFSGDCFVAPRLNVRSNSGTMSSHDHADSRAHLLPAKILGLIAKLRFVAHRSNVFTVSRILRAPRDVERLSGSKLFSYIEGADLNRAQTSLPMSRRLISCTSRQFLNPMPMQQRISNYLSLDNAKIRNSGCSQAECFIHLPKTRDPHKLETLN